MTTSPRRTLIQRLLALQRGSEIVASAPTVSQALQNAVDHLVDGYGAGLVRVWQPSETSSELVLSAQSHIEGFQPDSLQRIDAFTGRAGRITASRRAEVTSLLAESPALHDPGNPQRYGLVAYAGFPLLFEGRFYGVLELYLAEPSVVEEIQPLATFVNQLTAVIVKIKFNEEVASEIVRVSMALKLDSIIDATDDLDTILQTTAEEIGRNLKLDACIVQLWSFNGEEPPASLSDWLPFAHQFAGTEIGQELLLTPSLQTRNLRPMGVARGILTGNQPIIIEDTRNNPHGLVRQLAARKEMTALCVVPVVQRHNVIGAIELYRCRVPHQWNKSEIGEAQQVASAIAISAHIAHLEYSTRKAQLVNGTLNAGFGNPSFATVLDSAAVALQSLTKTEFTGIHYGPIEELTSGTPLKLIGGDQSPKDLRLNASVLLDLTQAIESGSPFSITNTDQHPSTSFLADEGIASLLIAPMITNGKTAGLVAIAQSKPRKWSTADAMALVTLIEPLGLALGKIKDSQLSLPVPVVTVDIDQSSLPEIEQLTNELRMTEIGERIFAAVREAVDIQGVLTVAVEQLGQQLNASRCYALAMPAEQPFTGVLLHGSVTAEYLGMGAASLSEIPIEGGIVEEVTRSLTPISINDCASSTLTRDDAERLAENDIMSLMLAPVVFNNQVNGLIAVHDNRIRYWTALDRNLLVRTTDAVAIALKYLTLACGAESLAERATAFKYTLRRIYSKLEVNAILAETVRSARLIFSVDQACIFTADNALNCIEESCADEFPGPMSLGIALEVDENPLMAQPIGTPAVLNYIGADLNPGLADELTRLKVKSAMSVKLINGDAVLLLSVHQCDKTRRWTPEDISILRDLSQNAQIAIDAARRILEAENKQTVAATNGKEVVLESEFAALPHDETVKVKSSNGGLTAEDLKRLNKDLEEVLYAASHDMRSPLLSIDGYLSHLERELVTHPSSRSSQFVERIRANTELLQKLINSLLDVSRTRQPVDLTQPVSVAEIINSLKHELQPRLEKIGGEIAIETVLPTISGSRLQLTRLFSNLINNAINYRDESRPLKVTVGHRTRAEETEFYVSDNGLGIKSDDLERIFHPLTRLEANNAEGTGMGLYLVKQIVNNHGGRIWVESQVGIGTAFMFTVPQHSNHNGSTRFKRVTPHRTSI